MSDFIKRVFRFLESQATMTNYLLFLILIVLTVRL